MQQALHGAVRSLFAVIGDTKETVEYHKTTGSPSYDTETGVTTLPNTTHTVVGVFDKYKREEIDGEVIRPEDTRFVCERSAFPGEPTLNDYLIRSAKTWIVRRVSGDVISGHWDLQLRPG